jgi:hypothetical protein
MTEKLARELKELGFKRCANRTGWYKAGSYEWKGRLEITGCRTSGMISVEHIINEGTRVVWMNNNDNLKDVLEKLWRKDFR